MLTGTAVLAEDTLVQEPGGEPQGCEVQSYQTIDVVFCVAVIPGTHVVSFQDRAADIFADEDCCGIQEPPEQAGYAFNFLIHRCNEGCHTIDGKHPHRGPSGETIIFFSEASQGGIQDFQAPSGKPADEKIFLHVISISLLRRIMRNLSHILKSCKKHTADI